jgi:putative ABC transport system substrate-binding protein
LKQIAPGVVRIALIYNPDNLASGIYRQVAEEASSPFGIKPIATPIHGLDDIDRAFTSLSDGRDSAAFFLPDITSLRLRKEVVELAARHSVPSVYWDGG